MVWVCLIGSSLDTGLVVAPQICPKNRPTARVTEISWSSFTPNHIMSEHIIPSFPKSQPMPDSTCRCEWARSQIEQDYHDSEWGVPNRDEHHVFEMLTLEGAQAGLSWETILKKRAGYRRLFKDFDPELVAKFTQSDFERLMQDPSIIRNRLKIESTISNAKGRPRSLRIGDNPRRVCLVLRRQHTHRQPLQNPRRSPRAD